MNDKFVFQKKLIPSLIAVLLTVSAILLYALKNFWSGIHDMTGSAVLAPLVFALLIAAAVAAYVLLFIKPYKLFYYIAGGFGLACLAIDIFMLTQVADMLSNIFADALVALLFTLALLLTIFWLLVYPSVRNSKNRWCPFAVAGIIVLGIFFAAVPIGHSFDTGAAVYAVGEEYQIVYTTTTKGIGYVKVGGQKYYDSSAGSALVDTVHKVSVPAEKLDEAKSYEIFSEKIFFKGPYDGFKGKTISEKYDFKPIDMSDGFDYYTVTDNHGKTQGAVNAVKNCGKKLDLLVIDGDTSSYFDYEEDFVVHPLANAATKGEFPIIYARGNHEPKGKIAYRLERYVGSDGNKFYYTVKSNGLWAVVLDLGEDHNDDWWEYYGTADYASYRNEQINFLTGIKADASNEYSSGGVSYRLGVCHSPVSVLTRSEITESESSSVGETNTVVYAKRAMVDLLNGMGLDLMVSGHRHQLMSYTADIPAGTELYLSQTYAGKESTEYDSIRLNADFPLFIAGKRSDSFTLDIKEVNNGKAYTGMLCSFDGVKSVISFTNSKGTKLDAISPFKGFTGVFTVPHP